MNKIILIPLRAVQIAFGGIGAISLSVICLLNEMVNQLQRNDELDPPEPKPLLADAKVGDLCQRRSGNYVQIREHNPDIHESDRFYFTDGLGSVDVSGMAMDRPTRFDIIATEPLAEEGSAEWALQRMKLGDTVCHAKAPSIRYHKPTHYIKRMVRVNCSDDMSVEVWLNGADKDGWQLYEPNPKPPKEPDYVICKRCGGSQSVPSPEVSTTAYAVCPKCGGTGYEIDEPNPEPAFAVGDWATDGIVTGYIKRWGMDMAWVKTQDAEYHINLCNLRKLDPSEVVVRIGCLSGTVKLCKNKYICPDSTVDNPCHFMLQNPVTGYWSAICFKELDAPTRELVKSLLKAQEEKC